MLDLDSYPEFWPNLNFSLEQQSRLKIGLHVHYIILCLQPISVSTRWTWSTLKMWSNMVKVDQFTTSLQVSEKRKLSLIKKKLYKSGTAVKVLKICSSYIVCHSNYEMETWPDRRDALISLQLKFKNHLCFLMAQ